jgi:hypothetical protein
MLPGVSAPSMGNGADTAAQARSPYQTFIVACQRDGSCHVRPPRLHGPSRNRWYPLHRDGPRPGMVVAGAGGDVDLPRT